MPKDLPNQREEIILMILIHGEKYGREIRDLYQKRLNMQMPLGSLYTTLDRMADRGYIVSRLGDSNPVRGGNRRKFYKIAAPGVRAVNLLREANGKLPFGSKGATAYD